MANIMHDSFGWASTATLGRFYATASFVTVGAYGRGGANGVRIQPQFGELAWNFPANLATVTVAGAVLFSSTAIGQRMFNLRDGATLQVCCQFNGDGSVSIINGAGTTLHTTAPGVMGTPTATHNHVAMQATIHNTTGAVTLWVNGVQIVALTNVDTQQSANAYCTNLYIHGFSNWNNQADWGDLYINDSTGSGALAGFAGDLKIEWAVSDGEGAETDLAVVGAATVHEATDESPADDETSYAHSSTPGDRHLLTFPAMTATTGTPLAYSVKMQDRKDDAGARTHTAAAELSAVAGDHGTAQSPTTSYVVHQFIFATLPGGGAPTIADINNLELGVKLAS